MKIQQAAESFLSRVSLCFIKEEERERFDQLLETQHYLQSARIGGRHLRYVAEVDGDWMAILTFSGAAPHLKQQEKWMGWSALQRARRLGFLINNSRFLPLVERERHPNLASKILGLALRRVAQDWQERWEQRPLVVESFVDESRFRGTCACGSRVVSGSASAPGRTTPRPRGATQKKLRPKAGGLSHVGREAHPTAPMGFRLVAYGSERADALPEKKPRRSPFSNPSPNQMKCL